MQRARPHWATTVDRHEDGPMRSQGLPASIFLFFNFLRFSKQASIRIRGTSTNVFFNVLVPDTPIYKRPSDVDIVASSD